MHVLTKSALILCFFLTGCGFHLRSSVDIPVWLDHVAIVTENVHRDLSQLLKDMLKTTSIQCDDDPHKAQYWIILEQDTLKQNITSISSATTARQYQLIYTVRFSFENTHGHHEKHTQTVTVTRQLTVNSERILGSTDEQKIFEHEMRREAAQLIIARISAEHP